MDSQYSTNAASRYFEDYPVGAIFEFGSTTVSESDIIAFATRYDPQAMHVDRALSARGPFGEVIASGWHTTALVMRQIADHFLPENGLAAPGIDELRWPNPLRPGDTLRIRATILEARRSRSKPDRGLVRTLVEALNQHGDPVLTMKPMNLIRCRSAAG